MQQIQTIKSTYIPVRVFNNGSGMNNVSIKNCDVIGTSRALWVHIFTKEDNKDTFKSATLNLDIYGNGNTYTSNSDSRIIEFGFTNPLTYHGDGNPTNAAALQYEIDYGDGNITIGGDIDLSGPIVIN